MIPLMSLMIGCYIVTRMMIFLLKDDPHQSKTGIIINKVLAAGTVLVTIICVVLIFSTSLSPFLKIGDLSESNELSLNSKETEATKLIKKPDKKAKNLMKKRDYIHNVELYDVTAKYYQTYLDKSVPGVKFKIKNKGNKTLIDVIVTVYFKDVLGTIISEENYYPILSSSFLPTSEKSLKPNYIWQLENGKFLKAESVPSEWKEGSVVAKITDIELKK